jgi:hypothetical protein
MPQPTLINAYGICAGHTKVKRWRTSGLGRPLLLLPTQTRLREELAPQYIGCIQTRSRPHLKQASP